MKKLLLAGAALLALAGCQKDADVASSNLSNAADNFEVNRRIVVINGITDSVMLTVEGLCSLGNDDPARELSITCKTGPGTFKKDLIGLSDNVTYVVQQLDPMPVSTYRYAVTFKPSTILPDVTVR